MRINTFYIGLFCLLLILGGCSKYEDGPLISLRNKQSRLVNTWAYKLVLHNGVNVTFGTVEGSINYAASEIGFNDEMRFSDINTIDSVFIQRDGDWVFDDSKEIVLLTYDDNGEQRSLNITRLRNKELWFEEQIDVNLVEHQLLPNR